MAKKRRRSEAAADPDPKPSGPFVAILRPLRTPEDVATAVREIVGKSTCGERELYEELLAEAEGWEMRFRELEDEG